MINIDAFIWFMLVFIFIYMAVVIQCKITLNTQIWTEIIFGDMNVIQCYLMLSITTAE